MRTVDKMKTLERVEEMLFIYLSDICDEVEIADGKVHNHMVIDGVRDSLKSLKNIKTLGAYGNAGAPESKQATQPATATVAK